MSQTAERTQHPTAGVSSASSFLSGIVFDVLMVLGLASLTWGLYMRAPWIAFTALGAILFCFGFWGEFLAHAKSTPRAARRKL